MKAGSADGRKLKKETRWMRVYQADQGDHYVSRLSDGSASITLAQLEGEWDIWTDQERKEFCGAIDVGPEDVLRFLLQRATVEQMNNSVMSFCQLPNSEAVPWLIAAVQQLEPGRASNFVQALALTKSQEAGPIINGRIRKLFEHPDFAASDPFMNWIAYEAACAIHHMIESGCAPDGYSEEARALSWHACAGVRKTYEWRLAAHFSFVD